MKNVVVGLVCVLAGSTVFARKSTTCTATLNAQSKVIVTFCTEVRATGTVLVSCKDGNDKFFKINVSRTYRGNTKDTIEFPVQSSFVSENGGTTLIDAFDVKREDLGNEVYRWVSADITGSSARLQVIINENWQHDLKAQCL